MMKEETRQDLTSGIEQAFDKLDETIRLFDQDIINKIPFEGSWSAAQVARHLVLSNSGFLELINGPVEETKRDPSQWVADIKSWFLDFNTKLTSPGFVLPEQKEFDRERLLETLKKLKPRFRELLETKDLSKTCMAFELPFLGYLTGLEAASFVIYHTQRHIHQLQQIRKVLDQPREGQQARPVNSSGS